MFQAIALGFEAHLDSPPDSGHQFVQRVCLRMPAAQSRYRADIVTLGVTLDDHAEFSRHPLNLRRSFYRNVDSSCQDSNDGRFALSVGCGPRYTQLVFSYYTRTTHGLPNG